MITLEPPRGLAGEANPWLKLGLSAAGLGRFLRAAQKAAGLEGEIQVLLADDSTLRRLNRRFRGKDKATDVLSFPAAATTVFFGEPEGPELVGDLAISLETAERQAARFGHTLRDEVRVLLLHGVLHLAGFDHERDRGEMAAREAELRRKLGLASGLIARGGVKTAGKSKGGQGQRVERKVRAVEVGRSPRDPSTRAARFAQDGGKNKQPKRRNTEILSAAENDEQKAESGRKRAVSGRVRR